MITKIFDARMSIFKNEHPPENKREFVIEYKDISVNVEKVLVDGEEIMLGEKDLLVLDASSIRFIEENFDNERGIIVYKEARITTKEKSLKEILQEVLDDAVIKTTYIE
jgi:hypothetical protein